MVGDVLDLAVNVSIVNKSGAWYAYEGTKIGQGRENAKQYLKDNPETYEEIFQKVRVHYGIGEGESGHAKEDAPAKENAVKEKGSSKEKASTKEKSADAKGKTTAV